MTLLSVVRELGESIENTEKAKLLHCHRDNHCSLPFSLWPAFNWPMEASIWMRRWICPAGAPFSRRHVANVTIPMTWICQVLSLGLVRIESTPSNRLTFESWSARCYGRTAWTVAQPTSSTWFSDLVRQSWPKRTKLLMQSSNMVNLVLSATVRALFPPAEARNVDPSQSLLATSGYKR